MAKFQPGDVVILNSGSPKLTVSKVTHAIGTNTEQCEVIWTDGAEVKKMTMPSSCFVKEEG